MKLDRFRNAKLKRPQDVVPVPELKDWLFTADEKPELIVKGLTSNQLFVAKEASQKNSPLRALSKAVGSGSETEMVEAFKRFTGASDETTTETAYRIEMCIKGVVDENGKLIFDYSDAAKLSEHFPNVFVRVTDRISFLSGDSSVVDKGK